MATALLVLPAFAAAQDSGMSMPDMLSAQPPSSPVAPLPAMSGPASMPNMEMNDNASHAMLLIDQLEYADGYDGHGAMWEAEAWYGNDNNKWWLRSEGESSQGQIEEGDIEVLWNHPLSAFWSTQLGIRHDLAVESQRNWAAIGLEGLSPYWVELEATAYASESGRLAARTRAEYTLRFTRRWVLQPEFELNLYSKDDPAPQVGRDISNAQLGLRLRYEMTRQFAPYVGVVWTRRFATTAHLAFDDQVPAFDRQFVIGIRMWF
jgi:copper resistance protein B